MTPKTRIGIIGTGGMANAHVEQFEKTGLVDIVSCYDIDPDRAKSFAEKHKIGNVAQSVDELLGQVDAVSIATSDSSHAELTLKALAADKHVLCEKPLTVTFDEARAVAAAARDASARGIINMVNFSYRGQAAFQEAMRIVKTGALGQIRHVHSYYLQQWANGNIDSNKANPAALWRYSKAMGSAGVLGDLGCHILDLTSACSEDFKSMRCELKTYPKLVDKTYSTSVKDLALDANDTALIEFELLGGGVGMCHTTRWATAHGNHLRIGVHGTEGALAFDLTVDPNAIELCMGDERHKTPWGTSYVTEKLAPTPSNWERFVTSIRTGVQDQPDMARGALVQSYLDTCLRSAESHNWEEVRDPFV